MKKIIFVLFVLLQFGAMYNTIYASSSGGNTSLETVENIYGYEKDKPLIERYILDELKSLRVDHEKTKAELQIKIAEKELTFADRALEYSMTTLSYFFYIITGAGIIFTLVGWKSITDIKKKIKDIAENEIKRLTKEYEERLTHVENDLREKTENLFAHEKEIQKTNKIHLLLSQTEAERDKQKKLDLYNEIIKLNPEGIDAYIKKAEIDLELGNYHDVLKDTNTILEKDSGNSMAYYYKACARANTGDKAKAIKNLSKALTLSEGLIDFAKKDKHLISLHKSDEYKTLIKTLNNT